uniref:Uncharacterized protein n=1 Tax=Ananas comosus var. bracteatus TaxID=296719 RepID=A0A6V7P718_ANACO|nr:unnamed protein product [Ananas comosus var. bracteatus]
MDESSGISISMDASPRRDRERAASHPCSPRSSPPNPSAAGGRKRRAVAKGLQSTLSKTSMLVNFLPTGTLLTFEMLLPSASGTGRAARFRAADGKVYYGIVTPRGLAVFKAGAGVEVPREERFRMGFVDLRAEMDEVMESFPLMVGVVCSALFLVFPNTRFGIGCMAA